MLELSAPLNCQGVAQLILKESDNRSWVAFSERATVLIPISYLFGYTGFKPTLLQLGHFPPFDTALDVQWAQILVPQCLH